jgi:hypothetical protein
MMTMRAVVTERPGDYDVMRLEVARWASPAGALRWAAPVLK